MRSGGRSSLLVCQQRLNFSKARFIGAALRRHLCGIGLPGIRIAIGQDVQRVSRSLVEFILHAEILREGDVLAGKFSGDQMRILLADFQADR